MAPVRPAAGALPRPVVRGLLAAAGGALALWLLYLGVSAHYERACDVRDTPYLPLCTSGERDTAAPQELRDHLARNPGDSTAWVSLAVIESGEAQRALLPAIAALAPSNRNGLRLRSSDALAQNQPELAIKLLVQMSEYGIGGAPQILGRMIADGTGAALVRPYLVAGSNWLPSVLASMSALKLPLEPAFPLLAEAASQRIVPPDTVQAFVRSLKAERKWADAYGLWVAQQRQPVPVLFNGGFEQSFQRDGFDWEVTPQAPSRVGAVVTQPNVSGQGQVLEVRYTGRAVATPVIRQYLFLPPGRYTLHGRYMGSQLRSDEGLAWAVRCPGDGPGALAGRSQRLQDTKRLWKSFSFDIDVPRTCGLVASLQLETFAPFEAAAGIRGTAAFDAFELRRVE